MVSISLGTVAELETCNVCGEEFSDKMNSADSVCVSGDMVIGKPSSLSMERVGSCDHCSGSGIWMKSAPKPKEQLPKAPNPLSVCGELKNQHAALIQIVAGAYSPAVGEYVLWRGMMTLFQCQLRMLSSDLGVDNICEEDRDDASTVAQQRQALTASQQYNEEMLGKLRSQCIKDGHSLHQIDQILVLSTRKNQSGTSQEHQGMLALREKTLDSNLLHAWTSTRERINSWLLHSLRSDDKLAQVHRSMMADQILTDKEWARLTVKYWTLDEAATGIPWAPSQSVAATDSRHSPSAESLDFWTCDESMDTQDGLVINMKLTAVKEELQRLKTQHRKKLYHSNASSSHDAVAESLMISA